MPKLPTARQNHLPADVKARAAKRRSLANAFRTFTQAAGSLERSYAQLQGEVARLRGQLEFANTELARSAQENVRMRAFLARIVDGLPCGVVVTDSEQRPLMVNPEARRLLAINANGEASEQVQFGALEELLAGTVADKLPGEQEWVPFARFATPTSADKLKILGVSRARVDESPEGGAETIWTIRDISDQKRAAAEREASRRAHALAEIATVLAHEIRNPLASMELFAGLIDEATANMPETREWVTHVRAGLCLLAATVNNVLQFHSEPCGEMAASSLNRLLRETAGFLRPLARERGLEIRIENESDHALVWADAHRLQQVFFNLALNAFRAMNKGGTLTIRVSRSEEAAKTAQVDFKDQGHGIDADDIWQIFEAGFTTKAGSPGLGLSVCRKVIEQHGGTIRVQSELGRGSTFSIFLPVAEELNVSSACGG